VDKPISTNPYRGRPGFWNHWNAFTYNFSGAAQVGVGGNRQEALQEARVAVCPLCGADMSLHHIERGVGLTPTRLHCPS
jgi:hypothetical protein